ELVAYAKQHPRELNYGSVGVGSSQHLAGAYFEQVMGVELVHVPYRNIAQYTPDFIGGQVPLGFQFLPNVIGLLQSGDARALAVTTAKRMTALPGLPTAAEAGVKAYETFGPVGMVAAANLVRHGVPVTVLEANPDLSEESRASTFHPPTLDMLDALGAAKPLIAQGLIAPQFQYRAKRDGLIAQFDFSAIAD